MFFRLLPKVLLAVLFVSAVFPAFSQVLPAGEFGGLPLAVGSGVSDYDVDWGHGRMLGTTIWLDANPPHLPLLLSGLNLEAEARDISLNRGTSQTNFRQDTAAGGAVYTWRHFQNLHVYGKGLMGLGSIDFDIGVPTYTHDTRTFYAAGGGVEYRVFRNVWVRADYEYQVWGSLFRATPDPQGFTLGTMYDFRHPSRR
jgi:opacity protein-like surface antigen